MLAAVVRMASTPLLASALSGRILTRGCFQLSYLATSGAVYGLAASHIITLGEFSLVGMQTAHGEEEGSQALSASHRSLEAFSSQLR